MRSVNKVILIGNLTRDPEMRQTPNGQNITTFGLATNRGWVTSEGDRKSSAEFHECVAWSKLAEICAQYLKKGKLVYVEGYLKTRSWDTEEGVRKFKTEIVVEDMIMLNKRSEGDEGEYVPNSGDTSLTSGTTEDKAEEAPAKEEAAETPAEETPAEETPAEETPAEETPAEETPAAEAPAEEETENPIDKDLGL
jgi:single-strand DNA-binding protein